ncbi:ABC transporter ATP-binding protein [Candidatus Contubernalis alkaliaceticus]|uniref:ABC transporter ATP-binding protein n=1 Tax=Candidatus Contubernalis alkaliaceticus TaxID=338645 RepID=UPI001F4BEF96|nr:ABC transporter ATP-binding protein [Candidatus Contubernalis alkalaceticus]UNC91073.1 ABC transporter ATP-binding protein [Candidatus Contubernalis alkalaceticus]
MENLLQINNLNKSFSDFSLKNISFSLDKGYIMGFIGPNGSGKSTTVKLIMNLIRKDSGEIKIFGLDHIEHEKKVKEKIGFVYDQNHYYEELRIEEMKRIISRFYNSWQEETFKRYMKIFNLKPQQKIKELSKGMKMKFSLAAALSHDADFIIMDEPTSGLDPIVRCEFLDILYTIIQDENKAILFSSHITADLDTIADYITFINDGELVFSKPKDDVLEEYRIIKGGNDILTDSLKKLVVGIREGKFGFEALTKNISELKKLCKDNIIVEKPTLDDIMVYTVRGKKQC